MVVDFYKTGVLLRGGDTTNDVKRDAARGASVLIQIELALAKRVICLVTIIADSAQHQAIDTILGRDVRNCRASISTQSACVAQSQRYAWRHP